MSTEATSLEHDAIRLPDDLATCQQMLRDLLVTVSQLRSTIDKQQAHIQYLVRMTFGRRSERVEGPTLFDGLAGPEPEPPPAPPEAETEEVVVKRKKKSGNGRRNRHDDLPREREILDFTEAEKACPCCGEQRIRIGADVSERLDYRPASLFVHAIERPTYVCRHCEQKGENIQAVQAPLPPMPISRGTVGAGLLGSRDRLEMDRSPAALPARKYPGPARLGSVAFDLVRSNDGLCPAAHAALRSHVLPSEKLIRAARG